MIPGNTRFFGIGATMAKNKKSYFRVNIDFAGENKKKYAELKEKITLLGQRSGFTVGIADAYHESLMFSAGKNAETDKADFALAFLENAIGKADFIEYLRNVKPRAQPRVSSKLAERVLSHKEEMQQAIANDDIEKIKQLLKKSAKDETAETEA